MKRYELYFKDELGYRGEALSEENLDGEWVRFEDTEQLRGELSLAEEGLANYAQEVECLRAALERIRQVRYGLEQGATDEERAEYWSALALEYRRIAAETLRPAQPQPAPHDAEG